MSNIRNYIDYVLEPTTPSADTVVSDERVSTKQIIQQLYNLRPPLWTVVGGTHATGVSRLLEELAQMRGTGAGTQESLRIVLPDESSKPLLLEGKTTRQAMETFKLLRDALRAKQHVRRMRAAPIARASTRDPSWGSLFGEIKTYIDQVPLRRIILDNAHYLRQDSHAIKQLIHLRKVVKHPFVIIFGVRLDPAQTPERVFQTVLHDVPGAEETFVSTTTLYAFTDDQVFDPILLTLLADQYIIPANDVITHVQRYSRDLKQAIGRNWVRLDVFALRLDEQLRASDPRPRSPDKPGVLTAAMLQSVLDQMLRRDVSRKG